MANETFNITLAIDGFENHWRQHGHSNLAEFVCTVAAKHQREILLELIPIDLEYQWRQSGMGASKKPWQLDDYAQQFPQIGPIRELPSRVIIDEFRCRWWWGDRPDIDEFINHKFGSRKGLEPEQLNALMQELPEIQQTVSQSTLCGQTLVESMSGAELFQLLRENSLAEENILNELELATRESASIAITDLASRDLLTPFQLSQLAERRVDRLLLGEYIIQEPIGSGGMGTVYKAIHRRMRRIVAIKISSEKVLASKEMIQRFHHEIRAIAQLDHPNIVRAFDAGEDAGRYYLVMELVPGKDLLTIVQDQGPMSPESAVNRIRQAAVGLGYAHSQGVIHRDVKPANLLLSRNDEVKVLDLGLARFDNTHADSASGKAPTQLTRDGALMGTAEYISPEQSRDTRNADARSDIYSLGCSLFYLLTGRAVFTGDTVMDVILAHHNQIAPIPSTIVPGVSTELDQIFQRMVAKNPEHRPQSMAKVVELLDAFTGLGESDKLTLPKSVVDDMASPAIPAAIPAANPLVNAQTHEAKTIDLSHPPATIALGEGQRIQNWQQQEKFRRTLFVLGSCILIAVLSAYFVWQSLTETTLVVDWPQDERAGGAITVNERVVQLPDHGVIEFTNRPGLFKVELTRKGYEPLSFDFPLLAGKSKTIKPRWIPTIATLRIREFSDISELIDPLASKDGDLRYDDSRLEIVRDRWLQYFRDTDSTKARRLAMQELARIPSPADSLDFAKHVSPDDLAVANQRDPKFAKRLVAVLGNSRFRHWGRVSDIVFTNRDSIISGAIDGEVIEWNLNDGARMKTIELKQSVNCLDLYDNVLAVGASDGTACTFFDIRDWRPTRTVPQFGKEISQAMAFSPNGKQLAIASFNEIHIWDMNTTVSFKLDDHGAQVLRFSRDGKMLVSVGTEHIRVLELATKQIRFEIKKRYCQDAILINDGTLLTAIEEEVSHWDLETKQQTVKPSVAKHFALNPVGNGHLAYVVRNQISLHDQSGNQTSNPIPGINGHPGYIGATYSPDGKYLAVIGETGRFDVWKTANWTQIHASVKSHQEAVTGIGVTPAGRQLASASHDGTVRTWSLSQASQFTMIPVTGTPGSNEPSRITQFDLDPNGEQAAVAGSTIPLSLLDFTNGTTTVISNSVPTNIRYAQPNQLVAASPFSLAVVDTANNKTRQPKSRLPMRIAHAEFSPNGKEIAAAERPSVTPVIQFFTPEFVPLRTLPGGVPIKYLPNGNLVCLGRGTALKILAPTLPTTMQPTRSITAEFHPSGRFDTTPIAIAVNPIDGTVAVSYQDGIITIFDAKMFAKQTYRIAPSAGMALDLTHTPDGRHLITANSNGTIFVIRL